MVALRLVQQRDSAPLCPAGHLPHGWGDQARPDEANLPPCGGDVRQDRGGQRSAATFVGSFGLSVESGGHILSGLEAALAASWPDPAGRVSTSTLAKRPPPGPTGVPPSPSCSSARRARTVAAFPALAGGSRPNLPIRSIHGAARYRRGGGESSGRGRCRRPTGPICRSSNGRCAPKGAVLAAWHPHASRLWAVACLSRRAAVRCGARFSRPEKPIHLCDACAGKPCLKACPVGAHSPAGFAYEACLDHVRSPARLAATAAASTASLSLWNGFPLSRRDPGLPHGGFRALDGLAFLQSSPICPLRPAHGTNR